MSVHSRSLHTSRQPLHLQLEISTTSTCLPIIATKWKKWQQRKQVTHISHPVTNLVQVMGHSAPLHLITLPDEQLQPNCQGRKSELDSQKSTSHTPPVPALCSGTTSHWCGFPPPIPLTTTNALRSGSAQTLWWQCHGLSLSHHPTSGERPPSRPTWGAGKLWPQWPLSTWKMVSQQRQMTEIPVRNGQGVSWV